MTEEHPTTRPESGSEPPAEDARAVGDEVPQWPTDGEAGDESDDDGPGFAGRQRDRFVGMAGSAREEIADKIEKTDTLEIIAAVLLALATISSAWSAYQATRWTGVQATEFGRASSLRSESVRASNQANVQVSIDVSVFTQFLAAYAAEETELVDFYRDRFREEFKPAFEAWLASAPEGQVPDGTPFALPEYQLAAAQEADRLEVEATAAFDAAKDANQTSDNFVLTAVLFASVLFFAGVGTRFRTQGIRRFMIGLAALMFAGALVVVFSLPQNIGF